MNPIAEHFGGEEIDLRSVQVSAELLASIPAHLARQYRVVPVFDSPRLLRIALADPDLDTMMPWRTFSGVSWSFVSPKAVSLMTLLTVYTAPGASVKASPKGVYLLAPRASSSPPVSLPSPGALRRNTPFKVGQSEAACW